MFNYKLRICRKIFTAILATILLSNTLYSRQSGTPESSSDTIKEITILHWNDLHARNLPYRVSKKDTATGESNSYYIGGTSNMLGYIKMLRDENTLLLNGGDDFQGTPISTITRGKSQIELLNLFDLDAYAIGNHEFDYGIEALDSALEIANFDYLSANALRKSNNKTYGLPYVIKDVNGVKCGIIGLTALDLMTLTLPKNVTDIQMLNTDSVITAGIEFLKNEKCDIIILLTHIGIENDKKIAKNFSGDLDIIIGGHSHTPVFNPFMEDGVIIGQAGSYARWLGKIDLTVDITKDTILGYKGKLIETVMDSSIYDKEAELKVEEMVESIQGDLLKVIGELTIDWKRGFTTESNLGQWEADAVRKKVGTDITFLNSGGIRKDLPKGNITVGDIWEINPFGNTIVTFEVTGKVLRKMLNNNIKNRVVEIEELGASDMIILSGLKLVYDSKKVTDEENDYIVSITVNGEDLDETRLYTVSTNNYVASQFNKYFGEVDDEIKITDTNIIDRDLIIEAVKEQKVIDSVLEVRIEDLSKQEIKN
ncbi:MAG TPA: bifunctional UDP-sugar hydrolase/5'-nucleotidase [Ignavibacteria bacterium]|nr:bifunctional UDP-sugar hydrolase/5'-nucleotidase [Ignavibacteria bacterium]HMR40838.1 bifunctional UDP-sugar hydrolase/5'-nucleotidase [Ignavibacteria bacterium]